MTDNVNINPGSSTPIATDEVAGIHFQVIKIADGQADSTTRLKVNSAGAANVVDVGVNTGIQFFALSLSTTVVAVQTGGANLANRVFIHMQNLSDVAIEFHGTPGFTLGTGTQVPSGQSAGFSLGPGITLYARAVSGSGKSLRVIEMA